MLEMLGRLTCGVPVQPVLSGAPCRQDAAQAVGSGRAGPRRSFLGQLSFGAQGASVQQGGRSLRAAAGQTDNQIVQRPG